MLQRTVSTMSEELEAEAHSLFEKWYALQDDIVTENPFDYIYAHGSNALKQYYDEQDNRD